MKIQNILKHKFPGSKYAIGETYDSLIWFEDNQLPKPSETELTALSNEVNITIKKNNLIDLLNSKVESKIYSKYHIHKQLNIGNRIGGYTDADFEEMNNFITPILENKNKLKERIKNCASSEELDLITFNEFYV